MSSLSLRLPAELDAMLVRESRRKGVKKSALAKEAIEAYLIAAKRNHFLSDIARAARFVNLSESREALEESLPLDNEALRIAERGTKAR